MNAAVDMVVVPSPVNISIANAPSGNSDRADYARCIKASKRVRWDIDEDVFRGRTFDFNRKFLPDSLTKVDELDFLTGTEKRTMSHVQGRTYPSIFGLVERFIGAKTLQLACANGLGDQIIVEGLVRFSDEELKHQELFRRIESTIAARMPSGYAFTADPNEVARAVLRKPSWAALALICHIELFTQVHYRESIERDEELSDLYRDIFRFHWLEECQHAVMDEIEWRREDQTLDNAQRERCLEDFIDLLLMLDEMLKAQSSADAAYFLRLCDRNFSAQEQRAIRTCILRAYRCQYIVSGVQHPHFRDVIGAMITPEQMKRLDAALEPILAG